MYGELPEQTSNGTTLHGFLVSIQNPAKSALLRLPTTDELLTYMQAQRSLFRDLGNRKTETESVQTPKADQALFRAVRLDSPTDDALEFDDAEALKAINDLLFHRLESCDRDGEHYILVLRTPFGAVTHTVSIPFERDLAEYRRNVVKVRDLPHNISEWRFPPDVPIKLYDKLYVRSDGYAKELGLGMLGVPPHHKRAVVSELVSTLAALDPSFDPN